MKLSAELFADFAACLEGSPRAGKQDERRRAARVTVRASVPVTLVNAMNAAEGQTVFAKVRDFSPRGVNIHFPTALQPGQQFILKLQRSDGQLISILSTVLHCHEVSAQLHRVGAEFTCVLHDLPVTSSAQLDHGRDDNDQAERIRKSMLG
jgi:c-di-GMP-binding flagellar brake protein YcgR